MAFKQKHLKSNMGHFDPPVNKPRIVKDQCAPVSKVNLLMTVSALLNFLPPPPFFFYD